MGIIIGKFRKKKTTLELLEKLDKEIKSIEEYKKSTELTHKKVAGRFTLISFGIYLIVAFILCYYYLPPTISERAKYIGPLLCIPPLILALKKVLSWYYDRKQLKNQNKLKSLKDEKKKILDQVMDKETYKVAKGILEKYAPEQIRKPGFSLPSGSELTPVRTVGGPRGPAATPGLRLRQIAPSSQVSRSYFGGSIPMGTPAPNLPLTLPPIQSSVTHSTPLHATAPVNTSIVPASTTTPLPLPRAILPKNRSVLNKMVEYLLGDGPSNRYALICSNCSGHNGMALKEEFEYLSFNCCYCFTMNPARKKRPEAPNLVFEAPTPPVTHESDTSDSERISQTDTESETEDVKVTTIFNAGDAKVISNEKDKCEPKTEEDDDPVPMDVDSEDGGSSKSSIAEDAKEKDVQEEKEKES